MPNKTTIPRTVTLFPEHWAIIGSYSKDQGYNSISGGLRGIIAEWIELKRTALSTETELRDLQSRFNELVAATTHALNSDEDGYDARANLAATLTRVTHQAPLLDPADINQVPQIPGLRRGIR